MNKKLLSYLITVVFIALILLITRNQWDQFQNIYKIRTITIFWVSMIFIILQILQAVILRLITKCFKVKLTLIESFGLISIRSFGNFLPLNAGSVHNAAYLKIKNNLPITKFVSLMLASTLIMILAYGFIGLSVELIRYMRDGDFNNYILLTLLCLLFVGLLFLFLPSGKLHGNNKISSYLASIQNGLLLIRQNHYVLWQILALHIVVLVLFSLRFLLIFRDLDINISLSSIIIMTVFSTILRFNTIFPGNLGLREAVVGAVSRSYGFTFSIGFLAGIVDRIISMFWIFLFGIFFSISLANKRKSQ